MVFSHHQLFRDLATRLIGFPLAILLFSGCQEINDQEKYLRPDWLAGKLFTQLEQQENLSVFAECMRLTGFDTIVNTSGSFTIFAPTDEAFTEYFSSNPHYIGKVSEIPAEELEALVKFHILQDAWNRVQLQQLDIEGWIDPDNPENLPRAYKKQTILRDPNLKVGVRNDKGKFTIVDTTSATAYRMIFTRSRKYVPVYFPGFFTLFDLNSEDYQFYFGRPYDEGSLYFAGGKVSEEEIFAENGFIYSIDRVVEPMLNARQFLEREYPGESYRSFLQLINLFPEFQTNMEETYKQPQVSEGLDFDTLYNLSYEGLPYNIHEELTGPNINQVKYTYLYHNGLFVPNDAAFQEFLDEIVTSNSGYPHWPSYDAVPPDIKKIIINTHLSTTPVYLTDIRGGFKNAYGNTITIDESAIVRKHFGSNVTFLGLNEAIVPKAFSSVTGPVYLRPGYSTFMYAMQHARLLPALTRDNEEYLFLPISDQVLANDSSLLLIWEDKDLNRYRFYQYDRTLDEMNRRVERNHITKMLLNQIGISLPDGKSNKEFIENLAGNYIIWDNTSNQVQGGRKTVFGWNGTDELILTPVPLEEPVDNGLTYAVSGWLRSPRITMWEILTLEYTEFTDLLERAGLYDPKTYRFNFLTEGENYTIFMPTDQALADYRADTLSKGELADFLKYHFVRGEKIFTDGKKPAGHYETLRIDESSSEFITHYSTVHIVPGPDIIEILDVNGQVHVTVSENPEATNIMVATDSDPNSGSDLDYITTSIFHEIDRVLVKQ